VNNIVYLFIPIGALISFYSIKGVVKMYAKDNTHKQREKYGNDVFGMIIGLGMMLIGILKILGCQID
jgi:tetrahydromethanopterin S-methyltransferase subunit B